MPPVCPVKCLVETWSLRELGETQYLSRPENSSNIVKVYLSFETTDLYVKVQLLFIYPQIQPKK